jgi:hypothetical protein
MSNDLACVDIGMGEQIMFLISYIQYRIGKESVTGFWTSFWLWGKIGFGGGQNE